MAPKAPEEQKAAKSTKATKTKAEKKPVIKKAEKKIKADGKGDGKKKRTKKSVETYKIYIYKVLKQVILALVSSFCCFGDFFVCVGFGVLHGFWFSCSVSRKQFVFLSSLVFLC